MGNNNDSDKDSGKDSDSDKGKYKESDYYPKAKPPFRDVNAYDAYTGKGIILTYGANNVIMEN